MSLYKPLGREPSVYCDHVASFALCVYDNRADDLA